MLFVDAGNNRVGIGNSSPPNFVEILAGDGVGDDIFALRVQNQEATDGRSYGLKVMAGSNSSDTTFELNDHDGSNVLMKVLGDGKTGVGTGSPGATLHTAHSSSTAYNGGAEILESAIIQNTNGSDGSGVNNVASLGM